MVRIALNSGLTPGLITALGMSIGSLIMFPIFRKSILKSIKHELKHGMIAGAMLFFWFFASNLRDAIYHHIQQRIFNDHKCDHGTFYKLADHPKKA